MARKLYVGTSGWNYDDWDGRFYPKEVAKKRWLGHYVKVFNSVEANGTFYRLPKKETLQNWVDMVPDQFRFAIKMWRGITHYKKLKDSRDKLDTFFDLISVIPTRHRGAVLVQIPPNQGKDVDKLKAFLDDAKGAMGKEHWRLAFEPRHDSWNDEEVRKVLDRARVALVVHDMSNAGPVHEPNDASFVYMRRHGPGGDTSKRYTKNALDKDVQRVKEWEKDRDVFVYYNNDNNAYAPQNAQELMTGVHPGLEREIPA